MNHLHRTILVNGRVQRVGYRASAMARAIASGLRGTACNLASGAVELHVEGERASIEIFTRWAAKGPTLARVDDLQFKDGPLVGLEGTLVIS